MWDERRARSTTIAVGNVYRLASIASLLPHTHHAKKLMSFHLYLSIHDTGFLATSFNVGERFS